MTRRLALVLLAIGLLLLARMATDQPWSLQRIEARYPRMSPVHIAKCDHDGDGTFTRAERACISSLHSQLYGSAGN